MMTFKAALAGILRRRLAPVPDKMLDDLVRDGEVSARQLLQAVFAERQDLFPDVALFGAAHADNPGDNDAMRYTASGFDVQGNVYKVSWIPSDAWKASAMLRVIDELVTGRMLASHEAEAHRLTICVGYGLPYTFVPLDLAQDSLACNWAVPDAIELTENLFELVARKYGPKLDQPIWVIRNREIIETTVGECEAALDLTTTPTGLGPRLHVRGTELWSWGSDGRTPHKVATFDTPAAAESARSDTLAQTFWDSREVLAYETLSIAKQRLRELLMIGYEARLPRPGESCRGPVLEVFQHHVVQSVGHDTVVHNRTGLEAEVDRALSNPGRMMEIMYRFGSMVSGRALQFGQAVERRA